MSETDKYLKAYYQNERDANRQLTFAHLFSAAVLLVILIGYCTGLFVVTPTTRIIAIVSISVSIALFLIPLFFLKSDLLSRKGYKYYLLLTMMVVISLLNIIMPKHGILGWAVCIVITNHYYNPKVGRVIYAISMLSMLACIYAAMFFGEYDPNLMMGELDETTGLIHHFSDYSLTFPDTPSGRFDYLNYLISIGFNRYISVALFYYLSRAASFSIIFFISNSLNIRTFKLFQDEIKVGIEHASQSKELQIAGEIQLSALPDSFKSNDDVAIIANLRPTAEVGGDFYDYFRLDEHHVAIVIGDVSGKGTPAAMLMMKAITCFKNFVTLSKTPSVILSQVNKALYEGNDAKMFVTAFLAIVDTETGLVRFANAGHNPPVVGHNRSYSLLKCNAGFLLGGMEQCFAIDETIRLEKGDTITLYTDGITEARNDKGEFYGEKRLLSLFNKCDYENIIELHHDLENDIAEFVNGAPQSDDMTYLTLKYRDQSITHESINIDSKIENASKIFDLVKNFLKENGISSLEYKASVVVDEVFSNISKYAYGEGVGDVYFTCSYNASKSTFSMTFIDGGKEFNQLSIEEKALDSHYKNRAVGRLGIRMVKTSVSESNYVRTNGKNILTFKMTV